MARSIPARPLDSLPGSVREAAAALRAGLVATFGPDLRALYLYGAVTFPETEGTGDLDYYAILVRRPTAEQRAALRGVEADLASGHPPYGADLDGWIILLDDARRSAPPAHLLLPELSDGSWALHRAHWLAGQCVILHGLSPAEIVPEPAWDELRAALICELNFAAGDHGDAFAVLNACRIIRSVATGDVVQSKFGSAWWALQNLPSEHAPAIRAAMASYRGTSTARDLQTLASGRAAIMALAAHELGG
jgi:Domain of unknown function (DUF4111)